MSETTPSSSETATGPVAAPSPSEPTFAPPRRSKVTTAAAWVGIVAGVVFIVAVVFFSGFILGKNAGGHRGFGGHHGPGDRDFAIVHRGPPPMFPMGPRGEFERPGPGFGPGGPRFEPPQAPGEPTTTAPARP